MRPEKHNIRYNRWTELEDEILTRIVIRYVREGRTRIEAFEQAAYRLERTRAAVGFRWNSVLRKDNSERFRRALTKGKGDRVEFTTNEPEFDPFADERYVEPKSEPVSSKESADIAIETNLIYKSVQSEMLNAQRRQVAYGLDKYPETLNPNSWSTIETIDHIIEETVDKLHYLTMLKIQLMKTKGEG